MFTGKAEFANSSLPNVPLGSLICHIADVGCTYQSMASSMLTCRMWVQLTGFTLFAKMYRAAFTGENFHELLQIVFFFVEYMLSVPDIACVRILGILIFTLQNSCCWNALLESNKGYNLTRCGKDLGQTETEAIDLELNQFFLVMQLWMRLALS